MRIVFVLHLVAGFLAVPSLVLSDQGTGHPFSSHQEQPDVCSPLYEAQAILDSLQPSPNAHLDKKISPSVGFGSRGWGDGLGWGHEGPLSTAFRLLPRFLNQLISPVSLLSKLPFSHSPSPNTFRKAVKITKTRKLKVEQLLALMDEAKTNGCEEAWSTEGRMRMFPPKGIRQDLPAAFEAYSRYLEFSSDAEAQFTVGFFYATGLGGVEEDQGTALLYYTFAALQGYRPAEMAMGYRSWAGISVQEDCLAALDYYENAASKAYAQFASGPPGGLTLPLTSARLSDSVGGIYGPHASWASTGSNSQRAAVKAASAVARGETEKEVLEYYQYHSDRDSHIYTVRLGRLFYLGSIHPLLGGIASGAEAVGEIPQSFTRAREYFMKVARVLWPSDLDPNGQVSPRRKMHQEQEDVLRPPAMMAASFLGRMAMRGEGQKREYRKARMWYERASELGDKEAHNGLGVIYRDGLGVNADKQKAYHYFQAAAGQDLAEAQVNLGKLHLERGELGPATQYFDAALSHGSPFEAFHLLASIHANTARLPALRGGRAGMCGVSVAWYKLASERGRWEDDFVGEADRAWERGEEDKAMLGWWMAGEMGYEGSQNNVAFLLERGYGRELLGEDGENGDERRVQDLALRHWVRSAAQDNVDAMVKVGDLYYEQAVQANASQYEKATSYYQTAADTQGSAMAYWNLAYMYEHGKGVPRDWHLAKRFYDLSGEVGYEGWGAVVLSLAGLYIRSWWVEMQSGGAIPRLPLFPEVDEDDSVPRLSLKSRLKSMFLSPPAPFDNDDYAGEGAIEPEGYNDYSGAGWTGGNLEDEEEGLESVLIGAMVLGLVGLLWVRGRWGRWEEERERRRVREEVDRRGDGGVGPRRGSAGDGPAAGPSSPERVAGVVDPAGVQSGVEAEGPAGTPAGSAAGEGGRARDEREERIPSYIS